MKKIALLVLVLVLLFPAAASAAPAGDGQASVKIPNGPKFYIANVVRGESVTVGFKDYPDGKSYQVGIGIPGSSISEVTKVGFVNDGKAPSFSKTFEIPDKYRHKTHLGLYIWDFKDNSHGYDIFANDTGFDHKTEMAFTPVHRSSAQSAGKSVGIFNGPTVWIGKQGYPNTVDVAFDDFYDDGNYTIFIGYNNSDFPSTIIGYATEMNGPRFTKTLEIPDAFKDADELKIAVVNAFNQHSGSMAFRYELDYPSVTPEGFFTTTYTGDSAYAGSGTATPFTNILNVVPDGEVTVQVFNFPADKDFIVRMGPMGTRGIGGFVIGTQNSGEGGSFIATYPIPPQLHGSDLISFRMESTTSDHYVYDYFANTDSVAAVPDAGGIPSTGSGDWVLPVGTYPTTNVQSVVKGTSVTISGTNFTRNDTYTVRMGPIGSKGVGGVVVATYTTGATSNFTATFTIPDSLKTAAQVAIRFESNNTPYYAFDYFANETYP